MIGPERSSRSGRSTTRPDGSWTPAVSYTLAVHLSGLSQVMLLGAI
jgi:hypothetical protein